MASTEKLVQTWMASGREEEITQIVSGMNLESIIHILRIELFITADISNDNTSLINVVKALGEYLTSDDSDVLQKGPLFKMDFDSAMLTWILLCRGRTVISCSR